MHPEPAVEELPVDEEPEIAKVIEEPPVEAPPVADESEAEQEPVVPPVPTVDPQELEAYWLNVRSAIASKVRYPRSGGRSRLPETVHLQLDIDAAGVLIEVKAVAPFADAAFTRAAMLAVTRAAPYAVPEAAKGEHVSAVLPITFK